MTPSSASSLEHDGRVLSLDGIKLAEFDFPISETLEVGSQIVVLLEVPHRTIFNENICSVDREGRILWWVQRRDWPHADSPYTGLYLRNGVLVGGNWSGYDTDIDLRTGNLCGEPRFTR